ncbi:MAG: hypothetical protein ABSE73_23515, partial [Planctomycetota bacterium]
MKPCPVTARGNVPGLVLHCSGAVCLMLLAVWSAGAGEGERLQIGEFTAVRFDKPPVIDGIVSPGEWDRALTTEGMMAPFEHELHESITLMSLGFDAERLYFLMRCTRGNQEWR